MSAPSLMYCQVQPSSCAHTQWPIWMYPAGNDAPVRPLSSPSSRVFGFTWGSGRLTPLSFMPWGSNSLGGNTFPHWVKSQRLIRSVSLCLWIAWGSKDLQITVKASQFRPILTDWDLHRKVHRVSDTFRNKGTVEVHFYSLRSTFPKHTLKDAIMFYLGTIKYLMQTETVLMMNNILLAEVQAGVTPSDQHFSVL